jgi:hypothetical protein
LPEQIAAVDIWISRQGPTLTRPEAIRRLVELGLAGSSPAAPRGTGAITKASNMAAREIDRMTDKSASAAERAARKRRLIKGPKEFRDMRSDLPKPKR